MAAENNPNQPKVRLLTAEQEDLLELYILKLDSYYEELQNSEKIQVEIETAHLKKILHK